MFMDFTVKICRQKNKKFKRLNVRIFYTHTSDFFNIYISGQKNKEPRKNRVSMEGRAKDDQI